MALAAQDAGLDVLGYGGANLGDTGTATPQAVAFNLIEAVPQDVPEPGSAALMVCGLGLLGTGLHLKRRS